MIQTNKTFDNTAFSQCSLGFYFQALDAKQGLQPSLCSTTSTVLNSHQNMTTSSSINVSSSQLVQARADLAKVNFQFNFNQILILILQFPFQVSWLPLPLILGFTVAFNLGLGSLTWVVATEVLPVNSRGWTHTLANLTSNICWFLVTKTFRDLQVGSQFTEGCNYRQCYCLSICTCQDI